MQYIAYAAAAALGLSAVPWSAIWAKVAGGLSGLTPATTTQSESVTLQVAHLTLRHALKPDSRKTLDGLYSEALDAQEPTK